MTEDVRRRGRDVVALTVLVGVLAAVLYLAAAGLARFGFREIGSIAGLGTQA